MNYYYDFQTGKEMEVPMTIDSACLQEPVEYRVLLVRFKIRKWLPRNLQNWVFKQIWWLFVPEHRWNMLGTGTYTGNTSDSYE